MKYLYNISRIHNCWNRFGIENGVWDIFLCHIFSCGQKLKITKSPTRENFWPAKYPLEKISDPRNTHKKNLGPAKYQRKKTLDPRNTHEKKIWTPRNTHEKKIWTPRNTHEGTKAQWHDITRHTRPTEFSTLIINRPRHRHGHKHTTYSMTR